MERRLERALDRFEICIWWYFYTYVLFFTTVYIFLVIEIKFAMHSSAFQAFKSPCFERSRQNSHVGITQSNLST